MEKLIGYWHDPSSWFSIGPLVVILVYIVLYDMVWTLIPDRWAWNWFQHMQVPIKIAIFFGALSIILLVGFISWPVNLILAGSVAIAYVATIWWLSNRNPKGGMR